MAGLLIAVMPGHAQNVKKAIAKVALADVTVSSSEGSIVEIGGGQVMLTGGCFVKAKDHTAELSMSRGGVVRLCQTSALHVAESGEDALLLALDRGAMEIQMKARSGDVLMTPDLRFTFGDVGSGGAPLDLQIRVSTNGDTCVDNRGHGAPTLKIADAFGEASYELKPGQHVTFEHGSLREVVDKETVPCGCPPAEKGMSLADGLLTGGASGGRVTPEQAAAAHPFPEAVSEGLAPPSPLPAETPGETHVQVATTLQYDPSAPKPVEPADTIAAGVPAPQPVAAKKPAGGAFGAIGRFFKRLFVR